MSIDNEQSFQKIFDSEFKRQNIAKSYNIVSYQNRIHLIEEVCMKKQQIIQVAASLKIKLSTAKYILRSFRKHGKILKKMETKDCLLEKYQEKVAFLKARVQEINQSKMNKKQRKEEMAKKKNIMVKSKNSTDGLFIGQREKNLFLKMQFDDCFQKAEATKAGQLLQSSPYPEHYFTPLCFYAGSFLVNHLPLEYYSFQ